MKGQHPIIPLALSLGYDSIVGVARIPWETWARWFLPLMIILLVFSLIALIPPVLTHWGPL